MVIEISKTFFRVARGLCVIALPVASYCQQSDQPARTSTGVSPATSPPASESSQSSVTPPTNEKPSNSNGEPTIDPGSEVIGWDGKHWNVLDNRLFHSRFEKYLDTPGQSSISTAIYQGTIRQIMDELAPGAATQQADYSAFNLLATAAKFDADAHLCDTLANQVNAAWQTRSYSDHLIAANAALEIEKKKKKWDLQVLAQTNAFDKGPGTHDKTQAEDWQKRQQQKRDAIFAPILARIAEIEILQKANQVKKEAAELQAKIDFQSLIVQLLTQRRFQHVLIATRFYRGIFEGGDNQLRVSDDAKSLFANTTGEPPSVGTLDSLANEAIRDVREGARAFEFLKDQNEMASATKRLQESFATGEYMPEIQLIPLQDRQNVLAFTRKSDQLAGALDAKDYGLAQNLVDQLGKTATDFDLSKARAAIDTAKTKTSIHIAQAKDAASSGDTATMDNELKAASEVWPLSPELAKASKLIFSRSDAQSQALVEFDQLLSQRNYRQIYDERMHLIAAAAGDPQRQAELRKVLADMELIETAIARAQEMEKLGNHAGAWETVETAFEQYPDDNKLNQLRADLTTRAADFVRDIRQAQEFEKSSRPGSGLTWYLKAQSEYPSSELAKEGIERITKKLMPVTGQDQKTDARARSGTNNPAPGNQRQ